VTAIALALTIALGLLLTSCVAAPTPATLATPAAAEIRSRTTVTPIAPTAVAPTAVLPTAVPRPTAGTGSVCVYRSSGQLPDRACTPGVWNPAVTQATIRTTICVVGWTGTIRPPTSYTNAIKREQLIAYGQPEILADYEEDHYFPLEGGGHPIDRQNLWPEPRHIVGGASSKDALENQMLADVGSGRKTLADAQALWAAGWQAYR
jgi:hypothetical protein